MTRLPPSVHLLVFALAGLPVAAQEGEPEHDRLAETLQPSTPGPPPALAVGEAAPTPGEAAPRPDRTSEAPAAGQAAPPASPGAGAPEPTYAFFARGAPGYYAIAYGADWALVAASAALSATGAWEALRPPVTLIGPSVDLESADPAALSDPRLNDIIGRPLLREKVPAWAQAAVGLSAVAVAGVVDGLARQDFHHTHALVLGAATSTMMTLNLTELLKLGFGRLRPDFRARYTRAACQGLVPTSVELGCGTADDGFRIERGDFNDGFKSFPSGHASTSFALATYLSLWLGSDYIWGARANELSQPLATLAIGGLYAGALFSAASRVSDNRHHLEDIGVGSALGAAVGAATWLVYFNLDGEARWREFRVTPSLEEGGASLSISGLF